MVFMSILDYNQLNIVNQMYHGFNSLHQVIFDCFAEVCSRIHNACARAFSSTQHQNQAQEKLNLSEKLSLSEWEALYNDLANTDDCEDSDKENVYKRIENVSNLLENTEKYKDDFFIKKTKMGNLIKDNKNLIRTAYECNRIKLLEKLKITTVPSEWVGYSEAMQYKAALTYQSLEPRQSRLLQWEKDMAQAEQTSDTPV